MWQSIDLLLPPICGGCGARGQRWCPSCRAAVRQPPLPLCEICGRPIEGIRPLCPDCQSHPPRYSRLRSWSIFAHPTRRALHQLKYRRDMGLAEALVPQLAAFASNLQWQVDLLVPVPLSATRQRERGYNQAGLISWPLSLALEYSARTWCAQADT